MGLATTCEYIASAVLGEFGDEPIDGESLAIALGYILQPAEIRGAYVDGRHQRTVYFSAQAGPRYRSVLVAQALSEVLLEAAGIDPTPEAKRHLAGVLLLPDAFLESHSPDVLTREGYPHVTTRLARERMAQHR